MKRFGQNVSDNEIRAMIDSVDIDQNNEIDFTEFLTLMKSRISRDPEYELRMAFDMIDTDGNGTVSIAELRSLMRKCNQYLTEEELDAIMKECDVDGNGELDFDEFKTLMVSIEVLMYVLVDGPRLVDNEDAYTSLFFHREEFLISLRKRLQFISGRRNCINFFYKYG